MPRPAGAPNLRDHEIETICREVKKRLPRVAAKELGMMRLYELVGEVVGFDPKTVSRVWRMMQPTTGLAIDYIRARAFRMARKVVRKANVSEIINILERPNVGVLEPVKKVEGGGGGFFISVSADSCGAVNVGVLPSPQSNQPALPAAETPEGDVIEAVLYEEGGEASTEDEDKSVEMYSGLSRQERDEQIDPMNRHRPRGPGGSKAYEKALADMRARLEKRKKNQEQRLRSKARKEAKQSVDSPQESL